MEACWAHNPEVRRSKLRSANHFFLNVSLKYGHVERCYSTYYLSLLYEPIVFYMLFEFLKCERNLSKNTMGTYRKLRLLLKFILFLRRKTIFNSKPVQNQIGQNESLKYQAQIESYSPFCPCF